MRRIHALRSLLLLLCLAPLTAAQPVEGLWSGTLEAGVKLRLVLRVKAAGPGKLTATLQSVDQGVTLPVSAITLDHQTVAFEVQQIGGSFKGTLNLAASEITGQWSQMGAVLPLIFTRTARAPEAVRPQEPKPPFPYEALEVSYENREANVKLAGTLTVPRTKGPFPAVLLITGSGPQDRNETIVGHKPFLVIADYLTRRGIAVLRVDDRGVGGSTGNAASATIEDFAADVLDGIAFLKQRKEIDATRIGLLGHSEGGVVAPLVASKSKDVAFLVLLAAPGVTGEQLLYAQGAAIARTLGASAAGIAKQQALQQKLFAAVKQGGDPKSLRARLEEMIGKQADPDEGEPALQRIASSQTEMLLAPGFRYFLTYDPAKALQAVKCPVLALNGDKDTQVPAWQNLPMIVGALEAGENPRYRVEKFPGLNHLFQNAPTGSVIEYAQIPETISPLVLDVVGEWIQRVLTRVSRRP